MSNTILAQVANVTEQLALWDLQEQALKKINQSQVGKFTPLYTEFKLPATLVQELEIYQLLVWDTTYFYSRARILRNSHEFLNRDGQLFKIKFRHENHRATLSHFQQVELSFRKHPDFPQAYVLIQPRFSTRINPTGY